MFQGGVWLLTPTNNSFKLYKLERLWHWRSTKHML